MDRPLPHGSMTIDGVVPVNVVALPHGGRVMYGSEGLAQRHLFGSVATPTPTAIDYQAFTQEQSHREVCIANSHCARTWVVSLTGRELQRTASESILSPLPLTAFDRPPAGSSYAARTQLKFGISAQLDSGLRHFFADANQSFEVQANRVCISWLAPANFVEVTDTVVPPDRLRSGFVVDALLGASAAAIEAPLSNATFSYTTHMYVPLGTRVVQAIPPFACELTIYQSATLGNAAVMFEQLYGDPNIPITAIECGAIPFIVGQRRTQQEQLIADATHIRSDIEPNADRWFTLRWTIRP